MILYIRRIRTAYSQKFILFFIILLLRDNGPLFAEQFLVDAQGAVGAWKKSTIKSRNAVFTNTNFVQSEIFYDIPKYSKYGIFAYVYHNYSKQSPNLNIMILDSRGSAHYGSHRIENIWYLDKPDSGRWFFISLLDKEYLDLPAGKISIRFWVDGLGTKTDDGSMGTENIVAIESLFFLPVTESMEVFYSPNIIAPETAIGDWKVNEYDSLYATNFISSDSINDACVLQINYPLTGNYSILTSVLSGAENKLSFSSVGQGSIPNLSSTQIPAKASWAIERVGPIYLKSGSNKVKILHGAANNILIDYLFFIPLDQK